MDSERIDILDIPNKFSVLSYRKGQGTRLGLQCQTPVWENLGFSPNKFSLPIDFPSAIFGPKTNISSTKNFYFKNFGSKKFKVPPKFGSIEILAPK